MIGAVAKQVTIPNVCYISIHLRKGKSFKHFHPNWNSKNNDFTIKGFLVGLPQSPLILYLLFQDIPSNLEILNARDIQPTNFLVFISWRHLCEGVLLDFIFEFYNSFLRQKAAMVWTRSMAISPGHQESRDAFSNPHRDRQSAPTMQPSFVQHVQSMAAAMAELTRQNQELTKEINLRRQRHEAYGEKQGQSQGDGRNVEPESQSKGTTSRRVPHLEREID